jgi:NADH-quinone oxidoreductase subunit F
VFLGVGAPTGSRLGIPGEDAQGVTEALVFLREYNIRGSVPIGQKVVVIGGGNAAIDAARTAQRLGAKSVTILYRRTRAEMPAYEEEVEEAEHEGVRLQVLTAPVEIVVKDGQVAGVKCRHMKLGEFDRSGRRRPVADASSDFVVEADQVIAGVGQTLDAGPMMDGTAIEVTKSGFFKIDPTTGRTSVEWIFAGGDAVLGPASVVEAIAAGERAADGIDRFLTGSAETHVFWRDQKANDTLFDPEADPVQYPRSRMQLLAVQKRKNNFQEVELPWSESVARREAKRCLRCDYRVSCETK